MNNNVSVLAEHPYGIKNVIFFGFAQMDAQHGTLWGRYRNFEGNITLIKQIPSRITFCSAEPNAIKKILELLGPRNAKFLRRLKKQLAAPETVWFATAKESEIVTIDGLWLNALRFNAAIDRSSPAIESNWIPRKIL